MIRNFSPQELAYAKRLQGLPPAQYQQALYEHVAKGGSLNDLLMMKAMLDRQEGQARAQQAVQMASEAGGNPAPQSTVMQDMASRLQGVAALPTGEMFHEANFAGGGIVAFSGEDGSYVEEPTSAIGDFFRSQHQRAVAEYNRQQGIIAAQRQAAQNIVSPFSAVTPSARAAADAGLASAVSDINRLQRPPSAPTPSEFSGLSQLLQGQKQTPAVGASGIRPPAPASTSGRTATAPAAKEDPELTGIDARLKDLYTKRDKREEDLVNAVGDAPEELTAEQAQQRAKEQREKALKDSEQKSYKDKIKEVAAQAAEARENRDTDRWLALAQGFFAMGAGKSRFALQNMAEGLGVTTVQLRDAEKEYRAAEKARKDRISLLEEADRKETLGDVAAGRELHKEAVRRGEEYKLRMSNMHATLVRSIETQISDLEKAKEGNKTRLEIAEQTRAIKAAGQTPKTLEALAVQQFLANPANARLPPEERNKQLAAISNSINPQRFEKPTDQLLQQLIGGGAGGGLSKGANGELIYTPGKK